MPDDAAGTRLTVLGPVDSPIDAADDARLIDFYAYPGGLAGPGDRAVFSLMRHAADVILVGAATVRIENYSGAQLPVAARQARQRRGQAEVPPIAVVTRSGDLDPSALLFTRTEAPPLILTCSRSFDDTCRRLGSVAEVIDASGRQSDSVDGATVLRILAGRGLFRILAEGGPLFLGLLIEDDLLDELCLTIAPILVGGASKRIVTGVGHVHTKMRRAHLLADDEGYLYTRYVKGG